MSGAVVSSKPQHPPLNLPVSEFPGCRFRFTGTVDALSVAKCEGGALTVCLTDVRDDEYRLVRDHAWLFMTQEMLQLRLHIGERVAFTAVVSRYSRTYCRKYGRTEQDFCLRKARDMKRWNENQRRARVRRRKAYRKEGA